VLLDEADGCIINARVAATGGGGLAFLPLPATALLPAGVDAVDAVGAVFGDGADVPFAEVSGGIALLFRVFGI
jgi:hypothetical protein